MTQRPKKIAPALYEQWRQRIPSLLGWPAGPITVTPLPGDASNRSYFRIAGDSSRHTAIVMRLADPEGFKASEEAISGSQAVAELPFLNIWRHLHARGLPVPQLHHYDQPGGWLLLEDLGDLQLSQAVQGRPADNVRALYRQAIDELVRLQTLASLPPDPACLAFGRSFDEALLMWEFDHFVEYGVEARQGVTLAPAQRRAIDAAFRPIAAELAAQPRCFTHRDYHSRNLMLHRGRLWLLDFQDALLGPRQYDLASLLRDSYIALPNDLIDGLLDDYARLSEQAGRPIGDRAAFRRLFDLVSVQRNLKAAGRFVYIDRVKHNQNFLPAIPRTLGYVRANCRRYPELKPLHDLLGPLVPELAQS
jgi:aminoglycoside/choline kinase family phosphotransferase